MASGEQFGLKNYLGKDHFGDWLGYQVADFDRKSLKAILHLKIREDHLSPAKRVHGGVVSGFFDFACGVACFTTMKPNDLCSTVELKVNYLLPVELGDTL